MINLWPGIRDILYSGNVNSFLCEQVEKFLEKNSVFPIQEVINNQKTILHLLRKVLKMTPELDALQVEVQNNTNVTQSALALIQGLRKSLDDAGTDPAKLQALRDSLAANDAALASAVTANTPAASAPGAASTPPVVNPPVVNPPTDTTATPPTDTPTMGTPAATA